jgi:small subunit ribosomal protein S13
MVFFMQTHIRAHVDMRKALTQIYGIGMPLSLQLCDEMGFRRTMKVKHVRASQLDRLSRIISRYHVTGQELKRAVTDRIVRFVRVSAYKGFRFTQGLPVRGQRTHTNARTVRKQTKPTVRKTSVRKRKRT